MRNYKLVLLLAFVSLALPLAAGPRVSMDTPLGEIVVELDAERAPVTAANFLTLLDHGMLDGSTFYRVVTEDNQPDASVKIAVIQGGLGGVEGGPEFAGIEHESTKVTGLRHVDGTISMARSAPGTATSEFFICIGDQPELDFGGKRNPDGQGFAAFGRVVKGIEVARAIHGLPNEKQRLKQQVEITRIKRAD